MALKDLIPLRHVASAIARPIRSTWRRLRRVAERAEALGFSDCGVTEKHARLRLQLRPTPLRS